MRVLVIAIMFSATAFLVHWLVWRVRIPARQSVTLLLIFCAVLIAGLVSSCWWPAGWRFTSLWEVLHVTIFHVAAMLAYVVAYSAIEERSPSMAILSTVANAGDRGRSRAELEVLLLDVSPVEIRLSAMLRDGMVLADVDRLTLTAKGRAWAGTFSTWRRWLRFRLGG